MTTTKTRLPVAQPQTDRKQIDFEFQGLGKRKVVADFSGGHLSSDGGTLLLRELDDKLKLSERLSKCFTDLRDPRYVEHRLAVLIKQRVHALALGYEDIEELAAAVRGRSPLLLEIVKAAQHKPKERSS